MNKLSKAITVFSVASLLTLTVEAQTTPAKAFPNHGFKISGGLGVLSAMGKELKNYGGGTELALQADIPVTSKLYLIANLRSENFNPKKNDLDQEMATEIKFIPARIGAKFFPLMNNFYFQQEAGLSFLANKSSFSGGKSTAFSFAEQLGYEFQIGSRSGLDLSARYEHTAKYRQQGNAINALGLKVQYAYRF